MTWLVVLLVWAVLAPLLAIAVGTLMRAGRGAERSTYPVTRTATDTTTDRPVESSPAVAPRSAPPRAA